MLLSLFPYLILSVCFLPFCNVVSNYLHDIIHLHATETVATGGTAAGRSAEVELPSAFCRGDIALVLLDDEVSVQHLLRLCVLVLIGDCVSIGVVSH